MFGSPEYKQHAMETQGTFRGNWPLDANGFAQAGPVRRERYFAAAISQGILRSRLIAPARDLSGTPNRNLADSW